LNKKLGNSGVRLVVRNNNKLLTVGPREKVYVPLGRNTAILSMSVLHIR
jgi:hypothetical protein